MRTSWGILCILIGLGGCRCHDTSVPPGSGPPDHAGAWEALVVAVAEGRLDDARAAAQAVPGGPDDSEHTARVRAALGFVQVALDAEEAQEGVALAAEACGACHRQRGALAPEVPAHPAVREAHARVWPSP